MEFAENIRYVLKKRRKEKGLTTTSLARLANTSPGYIHDIESGRTNPSLSMLAILFTCLDLSFPAVSTHDRPDCLSRCLAAWRECSEAVAALDPREIAAGLSDENRERIRLEASEARQALDDLLEAI